MPRSRKHKLGSLDNTVRASKRARKLSPDPEPGVAIVDEDNDLEAILAQIKEQEESERLAKRVQDQWNNSPADVVDETTDSDEALARRLAKEWASQVDADGDPIAGPSHLPDNGKGSDGFVGISTPAGPSRQQSRAFSSSLEEDTPDTKLSGFRDFFTAKKKCTNCGKLVKSPRGHVRGIMSFFIYRSDHPVQVMFNDDSMPQSVTMLMHAPCSSCRTNHCRGCFTPIACRVSCKGAAKNSKCAVMNCCAEGRAIAIFETLGGFDRQYISERATSHSRALVALAEMKSNINHSVGPGGTGYSTSYGTIGSVGAGHHGSNSATTSTNRGRGRASKNNKAKTATRGQLVIRWEEVVVRVLNTLTELLPSPYAESAHAFDLLPHGSIGALLSLSKMPELLGDLLRNDSVTDWIARGETYHAMVSLLRRMADCELTVQVLIGQRWEMAKSPGLESWMWGEEDIEWVKDKDGLIERGPPLYEHFQKLTRQCEAFLSGASRIMDATDDASEGVEETMMQGVSLCGDIIAAKGNIERVMSILGVGSSSDASISDVSDNNKGKGKHKDPSIELEKVYSMACEELAFKHVMLGVETGKKLDYPNYNFASTINQTQDRTRHAKDRLHLIKELAVTATSLPPGVWVRVDEIRNDAMYGDFIIIRRFLVLNCSLERFLSLDLKELHTLAVYSNLIALCPSSTPTYLH
jgi:hypothetical protein